jgi:proteic killer suppression protein
MIMSFSDKATEDIYNGDNTKEARTIPMEVWNTAFRKLDMVNAAGALKDLLVPPGNRLEPLKRELAGFHSIRINDQYRVVFRWTGNGAEKVTIQDYHS